MSEDFLAQFDTRKAAEAGFVLQLVNPATGAPLVNPDRDVAVTLTLLGSDSEAVQKAERAALDRRLDMQAKGITTVRAAALESDALERLVAATRDWTGIAVDGKAECSPVNVRKFYTRYPAFREQAENAVRNRANFSGPASTISSATVA